MGRTNRDQIRTRKHNDSPESSDDYEDQGKSREKKRMKKQQEEEKRKQRKKLIVVSIAKIQIQPLFRSKHHQNRTEGVAAIIAVEVNLAEEVDTLDVRFVAVQAENQQKIVE